MIKSFLFFSLIAASAVACGSTGTTTTSSTGGTSGSGGENTTAKSSALSGHVAAGSGSDVPGFGGLGALKSSVKVAALTIDATGDTVSIAEGAITASGSWSLDVPIHHGPTLLQGIDANGKVVVSALLEDDLVADEKQMVQPMTTESSVEAAVVLTLIKDGTLLADIDLVGLRARIDAATAQVVHDHAADVASESKIDLHALGVASLSAQASQQSSLKAAVIDAAAYEAAELIAANALTAALNGSDSASAQAQANADFLAAFASLDTKLGMDAATAASAMTNATASAHSAITSVSSSTSLKDAFNHTQAMLESVTVTAALTEAFTTAGASAAVMVQLQTAGTKLTTQVEAAVDTAMVIAAFEAWRTTVRGTIAGTGGLVASVLGDVVNATAAYKATITALVTLEATLQASLGASAAASKDKAGNIDTAKLAGLIAQAYAVFNADVQATVMSSAALFTAKDSALISSVFVASKASF